jgi:hypothetical protein
MQSRLKALCAGGLIAAVSLAVSVSDTSAGSRRAGNDEDPNPESGTKQQPLPESAGADAELTRKWRILLAPTTDLYPAYVADPRSAGSGVLLLPVVSSDIPDSNASRYVTRLGGRLGLVRLYDRDNPDRSFQIDFDAGFFAHFDRGYNLDSIGWDGVYGLFVVWQLQPGLSLRLGSLNDSAHVGDEYAERTLRKRLEYTREEWTAGISWSHSGRWRHYFEAGYAKPKIASQKPWRLQLGVEYIAARRFWQDRLNWYAAIDSTLSEERDWQPTTTTQIGLMLPFGHRTNRFRFGFEYCTGPSVLGEFFMHDESYLAVGWWFDY